ncbi:terminase [Candidatus Parcubacteria bacterium]|nr:MAG: terminase [Candidatus Parcubacteria bacterium]
MVKPHPAQYRVLKSDKRFIVALGGTQGGKTVIGPYWLYQEIQRRGPGDYMVVAPHLGILEYKALPELLRLFDDYLSLGDYKKGNYNYYVFSKDGMRRTFGDEWEGKSIEEYKPVRIFFGHAKNPNTLEAATAKAAWLDEAGQDEFKLDSWEAILRRLSINEGRVLLTTTPYNFGWLYKKLYKPWEDSGENHPLIDVVQFESRLNPAFPKDEWERAKRDLPAWKFDLFYRARFTRPAGLVFDCFGQENIVPPAYPRRGDHIYFGMDFGGTNTAAVFAYYDMEENRLVVYDVYENGRVAAYGHVEAMRKYWEPFSDEPPRGWGGSGGEGQFRTEMAIAGLVVLEPDPTGPGSVEIGIGRLYSAFQNGMIAISERCKDLIDDLYSYSYELDEEGEPIPDKIANKNRYHRVDALRYLASSFMSPSAQMAARQINLPYGPSKRKPRHKRRKFARGARRFRPVFDLPPMFRE